MSTNRASPTSTEESPNWPRWDGRDVPDTEPDGKYNDPPDHGLPTHSVPRFLWEVDPDTPVDELGDRYQEWVQARMGDRGLDEFGGGNE